MPPPPTEVKGAEFGGGELAGGGGGSVCAKAGVAAQSARPPRRERSRGFFIETTSVGFYGRPASRRRQPGQYRLLVEVVKFAQARGYSAPSAFASCCSRAMSAAGARASGRSL